MSGGVKSPEHKGKFHAGGVRARQHKIRKQVSISSGRNMDGGFYGDFKPQRAHIDTSPAVWKTVREHIRDYEYVDGDLDDVLMRALHDRVVYAGSACCHHEAPLQDLTIKMLAAVDRECRKRVPRNLAKKVIRKTRPMEAASIPLEKRVGKPLLDVVAEMFDKRSK